MKGRLNTWLLIVVAVCALSLWFGKDLVRTKAGGTPVTGAGTDSPREFEGTPIHLVVLNGTGKSGLARDVSLLLGRTGCVTERIGNAPDYELEQSFLVSRRLTRRQATDLALRLGGIRVIREWDSREGEDAVLVLGADCDVLISSLSGERK